MATRVGLRLVFLAGDEIVLRHLRKRQRGGLVPPTGPTRGGPALSETSAPVCCLFNRGHLRKLDPTCMEQKCQKCLPSIDIMTCDFYDMGVVFLSET